MNKHTSSKTNDLAALPISDRTGQSYYQLLIHAPTPVVVLKGPQYLIDFVNKSYLRFTGSDNGILQMPVFETSVFAEKQSFWQILEQVRATGEPAEQNEHPVRLERNGTAYTVYLNIQYLPLYNENGLEEHIMLTITDVTGGVLERKKLEEQLALLRQQKTQLESSIDAGKVGTWYWDVQQNKLHWSKEQEALYGLAEGAFDGTVAHFKSFVLEDLDKLLESLAKPEQGLSENAYQFRILRTDGVVRWIQARDRMMYGPDGSLLYVTGINIDITAEKLLEEQLEFASTLNQSMPDAVVATGSEQDGFRIISWNKAAEHLYGWKAEEVLGKPAPEIIPSRFLSESANVGWKAELDRTGKWHGEVEQYKRDGTPIRIKAAVANVTNGEGQNIGLVVINKDITEEYKIRRSIQESEERYATTVGASELGLWDFDIRNGIIAIAGKTTTIFGLPPSEALSEAEFKDCIHPDDLPSQIAFFERVQKRQIGSSFQTEHRIVQKNSGQTRWVRSTGKAFFDDQGQLYRTVGTITDITEQKAAVDQIRKAEERMRFALEAANMVAWEWNLETGYVYRSANAGQFFGLQSGAAADFFAIIHPDDKPLVENTIRRSLEQDHPYELEFRLLHQDGTCIWVTDKARVVRNEVGKPKALTGVFMDITKRKLTEEALRTSELEMKNLADAMPQLVWMTDCAPNVFYYNDRVQEYGGVYQEPNGTWRWEGMCHPDDLQATKTAWLNSVATGTPYEAEHRVLMKDGTYRWHLSRAVPQKGHQGGITKWYGTATDIHLQKINEERYRTLFNSSPAAIWVEDFSIAKKRVDALVLSGITDLAQYFAGNQNELIELVRSVQVTALNAASISMYGGSSDELIANLEQFFVEDTLPAFIQELQTIADGGGRFETETVVRDRHGAHISVLVKIDFPLDDDYTNVQVTLFDVTEKKKAELLIRQSETRFRTLAHATTSIIWTTDAKGKFISEQPSWERYTGQTWEEYKDWGWTKMSHPDDTSRIVAIWNKAVEGKTEYRSEGRMWSQQHRTYRYFVSRAIPILNEQNEITEWVGMNTDVHEQHIAEQALRASENRFRTLAEFLPQMVWIMDGDGKAVYTSAQWKAYCNIEDGDAAWQYMLHPDEKEQVLHQKSVCLQTGQVFRTELRLRNRNGAYRWHAAVAVPLPDSEHQPNLWVGSLTDIHDQKTFTEKLEAEVTERTRELQRSNADLQQFAHVASHDLKEPVRKVRTFLSRLQLEFGAELPPKALQYIAKMDASTDRMYSMIDGVLLYSSLNATELIAEQVDLNKLLKSIEADLEVLIAQKEAVLQPVPLPVVKGSAILLYQLFYNLINNSLKFSRVGAAPVISITTELANTEQIYKQGLPAGKAYITIVLQDNGIGFSNEEASQIFESFVRLHPKDAYEGTGLGLSLCKRIVERHQGAIWADSELGKGARFTILIPVA